MRLGALAAVVAMKAGAAMAAGVERPPITPLRDVDVTYRVTQPRPDGPALVQRMRWLVALGRLRVDPPSSGVYMIIDYRSKRMAVVKPADRAVLDTSTAGPGLPGAEAGRYERQGEAEVAGLACTEWLTADAGGHDTVLCLTADGVMLRASQKGRVLLEASAVSFASQDPADFAAPEGFRHVAGDLP